MILIVVINIKGILGLEVSDTEFGVMIGEDIAHARDHTKNLIRVIRIDPCDDIDQRLKIFKEADIIIIGEDVPDHLCEWAEDVFSDTKQSEFQEREDDVCSLPTAGLVIDEQLHHEPSGAFVKVLVVDAVPNAVGDRIEEDGGHNVRIIIHLGVVLSEEPGQ